MKAKCFAQSTPCAPASRARIKNSVSSPRPSPIPPVPRSTRKGPIFSNRRRRIAKLAPWRLLGRVDQPGLDTMIEPAEHPSDQRQRLIPNPPRLRLAPIRQNPSAKVIDVRETIDCILIGSKPARSEPNIVVREQKDSPRNSATALFRAWARPCRCSATLRIGSFSRNASTTFGVPSVQLLSTTSTSTGPRLLPICEANEFSVRCRLWLRL